MLKAIQIGAHEDCKSKLDKQKARKKETSSKWYEKNRSKSLERAKKWQRENRERFLAAKKIRRTENPEKSREDRKRWEENARIKLALMDESARTAFLEKRATYRREKGRKYWIEHKPQAAKANRKWVSKNAERRSATLKRWWKSENGKASKAMSAHKRRARESQCKNPPTAAQLLSLKKSAKGRCQYCANRRKLHFDHVVPLAKGGMHEISNLVMACRSCNSTKGAKPPEQFAREIGLLFI